MDQPAKLEAFYSKNGPFKSGLAVLRAIAKKTDATETFKWNSPVYTISGKNVFGIIGFKSHFGIWFFNGAYIKDPLHVLSSAQQSTKAMRHWKFSAADEIIDTQVLAYLEEAISNQKNGVVHKTTASKAVAVPVLLQEALEKSAGILAAFKALTPYKQREFCEYISSAKQEKTKYSRLEKSIALIEKGYSLNDKYR
jgi:uncharacterized protein YdeI (YjbR/CyaY-like superfamily)